jgi:hypothetical protein
MRIGFKILGVFLALFGVLLLSLFPFTLGNAIRTSDNGAVVASCIMVVIGIGFIFAGRHFVQLDPDVEDSAPLVSNLTRFLVNHRRELKVLAQTGFALSLVRLIAAIFITDWPRRSTIWFLLLFGGFALFYCGKKASKPAVTDNRDWRMVPTRIRRTLEMGFNVFGILVAGLVFLKIWTPMGNSAGSLAHFVLRVTPEIMTTFIYALAGLFFAYGELQPARAESDSRDQTVAPIPPPGIP